MTVRFGIVVLLLVTMATSLRAETLPEAWQVATRVNNRLRAQGHRVGAARAELGAARAARLPTLSNRTGYVHLSEEPSFGIGIPALPPVLPTPMELEIPLADRSFATSMTTLTVPLYTGGKIQAGIDARRYLVQAEQAGYSASRQDLRLEVAEAYFNVLRARRLHEVTLDAEKSLFGHLEDVKKMLDQSLVTRSAFLAAQAAWANTAQEALKAENQVLIAEAAYNRYMGRPLDFPVFVEEIEVPTASGDLDPLTAEAFRRRRELNQVSAQSQASAAVSRAALADRLPQVVAVGAHNYLQNSHMNQESLWAGGVGLSWTPFDGGASRSKERAALQNAAAAARMRDETRSLIELQVRAAWTTEHETRSRIKVAELGKTQADENLRVVTRQFQEGLVNHTEVLDAQTQQTLASMNLCHAVYDAIVATYRLQRAIGLLQ